MENTRTPEKKLSAVCGLFCPSCTAYIASTEEPERLKALAERFNVTEEEMRCLGCRSEKRGPFCLKRCTMTRCASEKGIDFCVECAEYPCEDLKAFQSQMPYRIELWRSFERIAEAGYETWYREMTEHFSCPECHTINSAYDAKCRACGFVPSCAYVELHEREVAPFRGKMGP